MGIETTSIFWCDAMNVERSTIFDLGDVALLTAVARERPYFFFEPALTILSSVSCLRLPPRSRSTIPSSQDVGAPFGACAIPPAFESPDRRCIWFRTVIAVTWDSEALAGHDLPFGGVVHQLYLNGHAAGLWAEYTPLEQR